MRTYLFLIFSWVAVLSAPVAFSQTFTVTSDTVYISVNTPNVTAVDSVYSVSATNLVTILWSVTASNFPNSWIRCLGFCDNYNCYSNSSLTVPPNQIWNGTSAYLPHKSKPYPAMGAGSGMTFDLSMACLDTLGCYYITVNLTDSAVATSQHNITYMVCKTALGIDNTTTAQDDIQLYPNPVSDELNITYSTTTHVKNITVYDMIGKVIISTTPTQSNSATIHTSNLPSSVYFVRLVDEQGMVIATRKFTTQ